MPNAPAAPALKLFIPGPTQVRREILQAQAVPMIGHRGSEMKELLAECLPGVRAAFGTKGDVVILSCSSTAAMEAVSRGVTRPGRKVLHLVNGNFSDLWFSLSVSCGLSAAKAELPWGEGFDLASVTPLLKAAGPLDAVFITHCETSTGALSDLAGVAKAVRELQPDALVCVDVTSTAAGVKLDFDRLGLDVAVGGVQKCWALPPALALGALSERAKVRMSQVPGRGYTNDFLSALEFQTEKGMTSTTPAIPVMQALRQQLRDIEAAGGMEARFKKHLAMQKLVLDWSAGHGFSILARAGFRSPSVTSIGNNGRFVMDELVKGYKQAGYYITGGYGKTKDSHWRIGHMGDHTPVCVGELLKITDGLLQRLGMKAVSKA
ncbi:MAG: pyridoxal-phosphate-dependent aminotransferase family protein [Planctomycetota bacterium]